MILNLLQAVRILVTFKAVRLQKKGEEKSGFLLQLTTGQL